MLVEVSGETLTCGVVFPRSYPHSPVTASPRGLLPNPPGQSYNRRHDEKAISAWLRLNPLAVLSPWPLRRGSCLA